MTNLSRHLGTVAVLSLVVSSGAVAQAKGGTDGPASTKTIEELDGPRPKM